MTPTQKIVTCLWFDANAEQGPGPKGSHLAATVEIEGQQIAVINGGPMFKLSEAVSLVVHCETQDEVDRLWAQLGSGGQYQQCGWLKDRYGLCWQIVPTVLHRLLKGPDPARAGRAMQAMLQITKLDIAGLQQACDGR